MSSAHDTKAARPSGNRGAVVQRCYDVTPEACTHAVALLLQSPVEKKKAAEGHHPDSRDDTKERSVDDFRANSILRQ